MRRSFGHGRKRIPEFITISYAIDRWPMGLIDSSLQSRESACVQHYTVAWRQTRARGIIRAGCAIGIEARISPRGVIGTKARAKWIAY